MIVLRRKGILVYTNLTYRGLRGKASACKAVDIDLAAVWSGRRACQSLKRVREIVRVIRQSVEVSTPKYQCTLVVLWFGAHRRICRHCHLLLFNGYLHRNVERFPTPRSNFNIFCFVRSEASGVRKDCILTRRKPGNRVPAIVISGSSFLNAGAIHSGYRSARDNAAELILHLATKCAGVLLPESNRTRKDKQEQCECACNAPPKRIHY